MIETKVPMDVRAYKTKQIGPFTTRQVICVSIDAVLDFCIYTFIISPFFDVDLQYLIYLFAIIDVPILIFSFDIQGMHMEVYLQNVVLRCFLAPTNRKAETILYKPEQKTYTKKEIKAIRKKEKQIAASNRGFRSYQ